MARDLDIANRLRKRGLKVVEVNGWTQRGSDSFNPRGVVCHHTAGPAKGVAPCLGVVTNGRPGLSGPLCNVYIDRNNVCYVVAAGRANHAGSGDWSGLSGNSSVYGIEHENVGTSAEPWTTAQLFTHGIVAAALIEGRADSSKVCMHKEWTSRKIDMHSVLGGDMRKLVSALHAQWKQQQNPTPPAVKDPEGFRKALAAIYGPKVANGPTLRYGHKTEAVRNLQVVLNAVSGAGLLCDGHFGPGTRRAVENFQRFFKLHPIDGIVGPKTRAMIGLVAQKVATS